MSQGTPFMPVAARACCKPRPVNTFRWGSSGGFPQAAFGIWPRGIALRWPAFQRQWPLGTEPWGPRPAQAHAPATASAMDSGDSLSKLLVPIRLRGGASSAQLPAASVLSELLVCGATSAEGPGGKGRDGEGVSILVVPGNPGCVMYYADYLVALRRALGGTVRDILCLCHAGHTVVPPWPAQSGPLFSLEDQIEHKVEFLRNATHYLSEAQAQNTFAPAGPEARREGNACILPQAPVSGPSAGVSATGSSSGRWILIGHSIGAHICVQVQKRLEELGAAGDGPEVQVLGKTGGTCGGPGRWQVQVIGLFPFLALNPQSKEQRTLSWVSHRSLLIAMLAYLAHALSQVLPQRLLRGLIHAGLGKGWSPTAVEATREYLLRATVLRNYAYMGMTEFDYVSRG